MSASTAAFRHRRNVAAARASQRGQAMTEIAVIGVVLVPLFLLVPVLAKYIHLKQTAQQATRAVAWQATVARDYGLPDRARERDLAIDRHFGRAGDPIVSTPTIAAPDTPVRNVMMNTFSNRALVEREDIEVDPYGDETAPGVLGAIAGLLDTLPPPGLWETPNPRGLVTAHLTVAPKALRTSDGNPATYLAPFDRIDLRFANRHSLLADAWNAAGPGTAGARHPRSVLNQVTALVPTARLADCSSLEHDPMQLPVLCPMKEINETLRPFVKEIPILGVPSRIEIGLIEPDIVPYDKSDGHGP